MVIDINEIFHSFEKQKPTAQQQQQKKGTKTKSAIVLRPIDKAYVNISWLIG